MSLDFYVDNHLKLNIISLAIYIYYFYYSVALENIYHLSRLHTSYSYNPIISMCKKQTTKYLKTKQLIGTEHVQNIYIYTIRHTARGKQV